MQSGLIVELRLYTRQRVRARTHEPQRVSVRGKRGKRPAVTRGERLRFVPESGYERTQLVASYILASLYRKTWRAHSSRLTRPCSYSCVVVGTYLSELQVVIPGQCTISQVFA